MLNLPQNIKKKVVVLVEEQELELYLSKDFTNNELKNIFSLIIPGYPSNFTLSQIDNSSVKFSDKFCKIHHLSGNRFLPIDEKTIENLLQSICFENEIFKKVKKMKEKDPILLKTKCESFSNPYVLFSFDNFMESSFNRINPKNYPWSINEGSFLGDCFYQCYSFSFNIFKHKLSGLFGILGKNLTKIFYILILLETFNLTRSVSRIEILLKIFLKLCFINIFSFFLNLNSRYLKTREEKINFSSMNSVYEKEMSIIQTLLHGIIRSGNLCAI
jgi:hypothetical protein